MNDDRVKDERVVLTRRKIQSDAYQLLVFILLISILIQQFLLKAAFSQFAVEFFCLIGSGIYISIRHLAEGIDIWNTKKQSSKKILINIIVSGVISVLLLAFLSGESNIKNLVLFFTCFIIFSFLMNKLMIFISKAKQKSIDDKLDEDEMKE